MKVPALLQRRGSPHQHPLFSLLSTSPFPILQSCCLLVLCHLGRHCQVRKEGREQGVGRLAPKCCHRLDPQLESLSLENQALCRPVDSASPPPH